MGKIEIILIVTIICVIIIDFFIKKKKEKIDLNLIGDEKIKFNGQSKFYYIVIYIRKYFYKLFLGLFVISLIMTNPTKSQFLLFARDVNEKSFKIEKQERKTELIKEYGTWEKVSYYQKEYFNSDKNKPKYRYFLKYNFFVFSIHQVNLYRRSTAFDRGGIQSKNGTVQKNKYVGVFNSFFLVSEEEERFTY